MVEWEVYRSGGGQRAMRRTIFKDRRCRNFFCKLFAAASKRERSGTERLLARLLAYLFVRSGTWRMASG